MQTAHAQSQPGGPGQKHSPGLLNNIWSQGESSGWPATSSSSPGWGLTSHIQNDASRSTESTTNDLGWGGSSGNGGVGNSPWGPPTSRASDNSLVVDTHDKEAWPSIGNDASETGSNVDDVETASAKSGSVISSSSNPGVASLGENLSTSSGHPAQNASSIGWCVSQSAFSGSDNNSSGINWSIRPDSNSLGRGMWGSSTPTSGAVGSGWGAANSGSRDTVADGASASGSNWQGMNQFGIGFQQNTAVSTADGWGTPTSNGNATISSSIASSGFGSSILQNTAAAAGASGWGVETPPNPDQSCGWGSPSPTPLENTGTDLWNQPKNKQTPNMSSGWGQPSGQQSQGAAGAGWGQQTATKPPTPGAGWGEPPKSAPAAATGGWSQGTDPKSSAGGWEQTPAADANKGWGASKPASSAPSTPQWGAPASNSSGSGWGSPSETTQSGNLWGNSAAAHGSVQQQQQQQQLPRPIGATQPATQPAAQPSSWADAASRGLPPKALERSISRDSIIQQALNSNEGWGKTPVRQDTAWDMEDSPKLPRKPLSSTGSTGSQDNNTWNQPNDGTAIWESSKGNPGPPPQAATAGSRANQGATGGPQRPAPPAQVGPASSTHWGNPDADGGTWEGPPDAQRQNSNQNTNMWNGPPNQAGASNQWGGDDKSGHLGSGSSGSDWGSNKSENGHNGPAAASSQWGGGKPDDVMWDRDGTHSWGSGGPPQRSSSTGDIGTWAGGENRPSSNWGDQGSQQPNWARNGPAPGGVDNGTGYWSGGPGPGKYTPGPRPGQSEWNQMPKPGWPDAMVPKNDVPMWGQEPPKPAGWGDGSVVGWNAVKPRQPQLAGPWGDTGDWNKNPMNDMSVPPPAPPQMRSRMLMTLTNMGFRKDEAQRALINNNMNLDQAIRELMAQQGNPVDHDGEQKGRALRSMHSSREDLSSTDPTHPGADLFVPQPIVANPMLASLANPQLAAHLKHAQPGTSLQQPSSLTAPSINPMLQKQMQPPQPGKQPSPQGQPIRGALQQSQMLHSQLAQQLQLAVQTGLVSPQLLNQGPLAPNMLIMLQQLLQLNQLVQRLQQQQQLIQQNAKLPAVQQRQQLEQLSVVIKKIKQQIVHQQQQIQHQQAKQQVVPTVIPPVNQNPQMPTASIGSSLPTDMANLNLATSAAAGHNASMSSASQQPQSRLNQWIEGNNPAAGNAAGFKQSHSTPNLQGKDENAGGTSPGAGLLGGDNTWSPNVSASSNANWPSASAGAATTTRGEGKPSSAGSASPAVSGDGATHSGNCGDQSGSGTGEEGTLDIVEFVPGKQWTGMKMSIEDDPFITPASVSRSLSVNQVREDQLSILSGNKAGSAAGGGWAGKQWSPAAGGGEDWSSRPGNDARSAALTNSAAHSPSMTSTAVGGQGRFGAAGFNRSMSMPAGPSSLANAQRAWSANNSLSLVIKNLSATTDSAALEAQCKQHGAVSFYISAQHGQALVRFKAPEAATRAQLNFNGSPFGGSIMIAELVSESEASAFAKVLASPSTSNSFANLWSPAAGPGGQFSRAGAGGGGGMWSSGSLWGSMDDQSLHPENLF